MVELAYDVEERKRLEVSDKIPKKSSINAQGVTGKRVLLSPTTAQNSETLTRYRRQPASLFHHDRGADKGLTSVRLLR